MTQLAAVARGLLYRGGSSAMIFVVALVAAAAATTGPTYYEASRTSILADTAAAAPSSGRGFEGVQTGSVAALLTSPVPEVHGELARDLGGQATTDPLLAPPILPHPPHPLSLPPP